MQQAHPLTVKESQLEGEFRMFIFHSCVALEDQALLICCGLWKRKRGVSGWLGLQQHRLQVQNPVSKFQGRRREGCSALRSQGKLCCFISRLFIPPRPKRVDLILYSDCLMHISVT